MNVSTVVLFLVVAGIVLYFFNKKSAASSNNTVVTVDSLFNQIRNQLPVSMTIAQEGVVKAFLSDWISKGNTSLPDINELKTKLGL